MLSAREAYPHWASTYEHETVVSRLEDLLVGELGVPVVARRLLDVGCGTARRLRHADAMIRVGVDLVPAMLAQHRGEVALAAADAQALPFAARSFDVLWSRLMVGHLADVRAAMSEMSRVCTSGGRIVISDLAPSAHADGHRRTFRSASGEVIEVEHFVHDADAVIGAATSAGLKLETYRTAVVDARVRALYDDANAGALFLAHRGEVLVHAFVFTKIGA